VLRICGLPLLFDGEDVEQPGHLQNPADDRLRVANRTWHPM
jgi:hypothetical protein